MESGDLVLIDYAGRSEGEVFDVSDEDKAREEGVYRQDSDYSSVPVLVGESYVIEGLEDAIRDMEVGEEIEVEIPSEKAYGSREAGKMETFPEKEFKNQGINVSVGEQLMIGQQTGRVVSKGSGRVRIDFNHPLSGKDLEYWVKVEEKVEDDERVARQIYNYRVGHGGENLEFNEDTVSAPGTHSHDDHEHEVPEEVRDNVREEILENTGFEEVEFEE